MENSQSSSAKALPSSGARRPAKRQSRLERFQEPYRKFLRALTICSDRVEDLADTFPGLLFALATGYGSPEQRERCFELIEDGAPLKQAAEALGLPWWLRKLPAAAFTEPLGDLPKGNSFTRRVMNDIPEKPREAGDWYARVTYAYRACHEDFALWIARQTRFPFRKLAGDPFTLLASWAWHGDQPETFGHSLLRKRWESRLSLKRAYDEARAWERRVDLAVCLGAGLKDTWFEPGSVNGFEFVPLTSIDEFLSESKAMGNCLDQYADRVSSGTARVFSVRREGIAVANIEIVPHEDDIAMPAIEQLRAPRNARAVAEIWQAAYAWLGQQQFRALRPSSEKSVRRARSEVWNAIWGPYLATLKGKPEFRRVRDFALQAHGRDAITRLAERELLDL